MHLVSTGGSGGLLGKLPDLCLGREDGQAAGRDVGPRRPSGSSPILTDTEPPGLSLMGQDCSNLGCLWVSIARLCKW